jgi:hypothetical protein
MSSCGRIRDEIDSSDYRKAANALFENVKTLHVQLTQCYYDARNLGGRYREFLEIIFREHNLLHETLSNLEGSIQEFCSVIAGPLEANASAPTELFSALEAVNIGLDTLLSAYEEHARNVFANFECVERLNHIMLLCRIWNVRFALMQDTEAEFNNFDEWRQMSTFRSDLSNSLLKIETLARNLKRLDTAYVQNIVHEVLASSMQSSSSGDVTPLRDALANVCVDSATGAPILKKGKISFDPKSLSYRVLGIYNNMRRLIEESGVSTDVG